MMDGKNDIPAVIGDENGPHDGSDQPLDLSVTLALADLLPDANGEVVILTEEDNPHLSIVTDLRILESGVSPDHVTAGGIDVGGLQYWVFEDGTRLYYNQGLSISLDHVGV